MGLIPVPLTHSSHFATFRHRDIRPSLPGQGQEEQGLLCPEADEDPRRDPTKARATRPQRERGPDRGQPPLPHPTVSLPPSLGHKRSRGGVEVVIKGLNFFDEEGQSGRLCILTC